MASTHRGPDIQRFAIPDPRSVSLHPLIGKHLAWLNQENALHNLTRVPPERWLVRHVLDSLAPLLAGWAVRDRLIDLGTGGGFPGLPLAIQAGISSFTLLDSKRKAVEGLSRFLDEVELSGRGTVLFERAEVLGRSEGHRASYDRVVVRALGSLPVLIELGVPLLSLAGELWCWKSDLEEVDTVSRALYELQGSLSKILSYRLPGESRDRFVISIIRTGQVPAKYPRRVGMPTKRPLV